MSIAKFTKKDFRKQDFRSRPGNRMFTLQALANEKLAPLNDSELIFLGRLMDQCYLEGMLDTCHSLNFEADPIFQKKVAIP